MRPVLVLRHVPHVPLGSLAHVFASRGVEYRQIDLFEEAPKRLPLEESSGLVVLGGPMNADEVEAYPYLLPELDWIREAVRRETPLLGICLGAQLMAKALGKRVYHNSVKEIGWYEIEPLPAAQDDPLLAGAAPVETVFEWHGDTFDLPEGAVHLARTPRCANQVFRLGPSAWGIQYHVEMTRPLVHEWLSEPGFDAELQQLDYIDPAEIVRQMPERLSAMESFCHRTLGRFAELCLEQG